MGMFDWLNCDYPLPNGKQPDTPQRYEEACYQTKDLDNGLDRYRITKEGRLLFEHYGEWTGDDKTGELVNYTGSISFYGGGDGMRDIYTAVFVEGVLLTIVDGWGNEEDRTPLTLDQIDELVWATVPLYSKLRFATGQNEEER